jgi:membrane protein implicated in regulation of membrane protease activity
MSWETFYLIAFWIGFLWAAISFLGGSLHLGHFHWHGHHAGAPHGGRVATKGGHVSPFNFMTLAAFLAWFGGSGYLLERYSTLWALFALIVALFIGLIGGAIVFWFLAKLSSYEAPLDPADYEMVGVLGKIASPIRTGGTGELLYLRADARKGVPARSDEGIEIPRGTEVVVTRYEKGVAYVRRWDDLSKGL